jgi:nucleoside-diphosphate-sugar epimerase
VLLDDVARAHVLALDSKRVRSDQNLVIVSNGGDAYKWDEFVPVIKELYPGEIEKGIFNPKPGQKIIPRR